MRCLGQVPAQQMACSRDLASLFSLQIRCYSTVRQCCCASRHPRRVCTSVVLQVCFATQDKDDFVAQGTRKPASPLSCEAYGKHVLPVCFKPHMRDCAFLSFLGSSQVGNCLLQSEQLLSEGISALSSSPYVRASHTKRNRKANRDKLVLDHTNIHNCNFCHN